MSNPLTEVNRLNISSNAGRAPPTLEARGGLETDLISTTHGIYCYIH